MQEGDDFSQKPLEKADFIVQMTGPAMVRPVSSDKWKAPLREKQPKVLYMLTTYHLPFKGQYKRKKMPA